VCGLRIGGGDRERERVYSLHHVEVIVVEAGVVVVVVVVVREWYEDQGGQWVRCVRSSRVSDSSSSSRRRRRRSESRSRTTPASRQREERVHCTTDTRGP